jgi:hypothetical protein
MVLSSTHLPLPRFPPTLERHPQPQTPMCSMVAQVIEASRPSKAAAALHEKLQTLEAWISDRQLSNDLQRTVYSHYLHCWTQESGEVRVAVGAGCMLAAACRYNNACLLSTVAA